MCKFSYGAVVFLLLLFSKLSFANEEASTVKDFLKNRYAPQLSTLLEVEGCVSIDKGEVYEWLKERYNGHGVIPIGSKNHDDLKGRLVLVVKVKCLQDDVASMMIRFSDPGDSPHVLEVFEDRYTYVGWMSDYSPLINFRDAINDALEDFTAANGI